MINNAIEKFRVNNTTGAGYVVYYKNANGTCYAYGVNYNKHGCIVYSPATRITNRSYEVAKPTGIIF